MGGIPTNRFGQVVVPVHHGPEEPVPGFYAVGECACVSVHGANRLGGNSLLDIIVFGRAAGNHMLEYLAEHRHHRDLPEAAIERALARLARWDQKGEGESVDMLCETLRKTMEEYCGVFRTREVLEEGVRQVESLARRLDDARLKDHSKVFNTARIEALELENLMDVALATVHSAAARRRIARRALAPGLSQARRYPVAQAHTLQPPGPAHRLQTGAHQAHDRRTLSARGTPILGVAMSIRFSIYRFNPEADSVRVCRITNCRTRAAARCFWMRFCC